MVSNTNNRKLAFKFNLISTGIALAVVTGFLAMPSSASAQSRASIIYGHAKDLKCAGDEMKDEVKAHFRRSRNYGKMIAASSQIRGKAAAIERRIKRDPCYRTLEKDVKKLDELTCKLNALYEEAMIRAAKCLDKPVLGDTRHVARKIHMMLDASRCMVLATHSHYVALAPEISTSPMFTPVSIYEREPFPADGVLDRSRAPGHSVLSR